MSPTEKMKVANEVAKIMNGMKQMTKHEVISARIYKVPSFQPHKKPRKTILQGYDCITGCWHSKVQ